MKRKLIATTVLAGVLTLAAPLTAQAKVPTCLEKRAGQLHVQVGYCP